MKNRAQFRCDRSRNPRADLAPVDAHNRHDERRRSGNEGLPRGENLFEAELSFLQFQTFRHGDFDQRGPCDAAQDGMIELTRDDNASLADDPSVRCRPFGDHAQGIDKPGLVGAALTRQLAREYVGQQGNRLDIDPFPTQVGSGDDAYALARGNLAFFRIYLTRRDDEAWTHGRRRKNMVARRHAPRYLHIDIAVIDPIPRHDFADHHSERAGPHRRGNLQFRERIGEPLEMAFLVDQGAAKDFAYFIYAIGALVAAVVDMNHGVAVQDVAAIDISYPAHALSRFPRRSQRPTGPRSKDRGDGHEAFRTSGLPNSCERHGYAVASCRLPARTSSGCARLTSRSAVCDSFQILVVHLRHFFWLCCCEDSRPPLRIPAGVAKKSPGRIRCRLRAGSW